MSPDRLSPLDASFLHAENHISHMHVASVATFEGPPPPFADITELVDAKLDPVRRYRQKVRFVPFDLGRPVWVDDPYFNLEYHLRHSALPAPGGESELRKLVGRVMAQPLDRSKPLWEIWVIEGLDDGRWAILAKIHHALVDGVSGTDPLALLTDVDRDTTRPEPSPWSPQPEPSSRDLVLDALERVARSPHEQLGAARDQTRALGRMAREALDAVTGRFSGGRPVRPTPSSSLNGPLGPHRRYAWATTSVDDVKRVRHALGGTFNDVVLASVTNGFRELLLARDEDVDRVVRALVPVSVWPQEASGPAVGEPTFAEEVSATFAELPVDLEDPALRLRAVSEQMKGFTDSHQAVAGEALTSISGFVPLLLLAQGMRLATEEARRTVDVVDTVITNVPGPQFPLYAAGRRMRRAFPCVPLAGQVRLGIAIFSYDGEVTYGITGDYDTTADIDVLAGGIEDGMARMLKTCEQPPR